MPGPLYDSALQVLEATLRQAPPAVAAASTEKPKDTLRSLRWAGLLGSNLWDAVPTLDALDRPHTREANPLMRPLTSNPVALVATKAGAGVLEALLLDRVARKHPKLANGIGLGITGALAGVGIHNLRQGRK